MPLARHDIAGSFVIISAGVSTHMPLARHDAGRPACRGGARLVSTHMPLARHDVRGEIWQYM